MVLVQRQYDDSPEDHRIHGCTWARIALQASSSVTMRGKLGHWTGTKIRTAHVRLSRSVRKRVGLDGGGAGKCGRMRSIQLLTENGFFNVVEPAANLEPPGRAPGVPLVDRGHHQRELVPQQ